MVSATLAAAALVALLSAVAYAMVAWRLRDRAPANPNDAWALDHFALWWGATAANILVAGILYLAAAFDRITLQFQLADSILQRVLLAVSLWGLVTYLLYLITGKRYGGLTGVLYAAHGAFMVAILFAGDPNGVMVGSWRTDLTYAEEPPPIVSLVNALLVVGAPVAASIAYLVIAVRLPRGHGEQRFRSIVVATALVFWWVVAVIAGQRELLDVEWLQLVNRGLGLLAVSAIVIAYRPPEWLRRHWSPPTVQAPPAKQA